MSVEFEADEILDDLRCAVDHGIIVSRLAYMMAKELEYSEEFCYDMAQAGMLHDVGKMRLREYLNGRNKEVLGVEEMKYIRMHPEFSFEILKKRNYNDMILESVYHHHENYDGSGYPDNLKGEDICDGARILRICDVLAALVSERPYRTAFSVDTAMELLIEEAKNFDMRMFLAMQRIMHSHEFEDLKIIIEDANQYVRLGKERMNDDYTAT